MMWPIPAKTATESTHVPNPHHMVDIEYGFFELATAKAGITQTGIRTNLINGDGWLYSTFALQPAHTVAP